MIAEQPETPELPQIMSDEEIEASIPKDDDMIRSYQRPPTDKQLAEDAIATMKTLFPRIHQQLVALWGTLQGEAYLDGLIVDERGNRQGFPADALRALLVLQRVHFQQFGTFRRVDPWDVGSRKK
jgi:hypothetical protein